MAARTIAIIAAASGVAWPRSRAAPDPAVVMPSTDIGHLPHARPGARLLGLREGK